VSTPHLDEAYALHAAQPWPLGPALHLARALSQAGQREAAVEAMDLYAARYGVAGKAAEALVTVAERCASRHLAPGEVVVREGERSDTVYVVLHGAVNVEREGIGRLATLTRGQSFGEIAAFAGTPRTATVIARDPCELLSVTRTTLAQLVAYFPPLEHILAAVYRDRLLAQLVPPGSLLSSLDPERRHALFAQFVPMDLLPGQVVLRESQEGIGFGIIVSGRAKVWRYALDRRVEVLGHLGPGDLFGEVSMLYEMPAMASIEAVSTLTLYLLPRAAFIDFVRRWPIEAQRLQALARKRLGYEQKGPSIDPGSWAFGLMDAAPEDAFEAQGGGCVCPRCGFEQTPGITCLSCGAHMSKERARMNDAGLRAQMAPLSRGQS